MFCKNCRNEVHWEVSNSVRSIFITLAPRPLNKVLHFVNGDLKTILTSTSLSVLVFTDLETGTDSPLTYIALISVITLATVLPVSEVCLASVIKA